MPIHEYCLNKGHDSAGLNAAFLQSTVEKELMQSGLTGVSVRSWMRWADIEEKMQAG